MATATAVANKGAKAVAEAVVELTPLQIGVGVSVLLFTGMAMGFMEADRQNKLLHRALSDLRLRLDDRGEQLRDFAGEVLKEVKSHHGAQAKTS